jgi:hypothetical protein
MKTIKLTGYSIAVALGIAFFVGCAKDEPEAIVLPPIGGYNSADEVGAADLLAYWPLNGSGIESKSNTSPLAAVGATYEAGAKGQGVKLINGYLSYPEIAALGSTLPSMTVSLWAKITNNGGPNTTTGRPTMLFNMSRPNEWAGNFSLFAETGGRAAANDTVVMKGLVVIKTATGGQNFQDVINSPKPSVADLADGHTGNPNKNGGKWAQYVATWDALSGKFILFANGEKISNTKYELRGGGTSLPLNFFTPTKPLIGTFQTVLAGNPDAWQTSAEANIDEIRVWKKALNSTDVKALYELEKAGR